MYFNLPWRLLSLLFLFFASAFHARAQAAYVLDDPARIHRLDQVVEVFIDSTSELSISEVSSPDFQHHFTRRGNLIFGYLKPHLWLKVKTRTSSSRTNWYLEIPAPFLEYVDFYQQIDSNRWKTSMAGYYRKQSERDVSHTGHVVPLIFQADSTNTIFIKISGSSPKTFPLYVVEKDTFFDWVRYDDVGYGIFFGILLVMFFYNFFIYLTLRQTNYLLYICTIVCTFLIFASASGYAGKFLWPETPRLNFYAGRLTLGTLTIFLSYFTIRFLDVKSYSRTMYYVLWSLMPLGLVAMLLVATETLSSAGNNLISLSTVVYMTTGIVCRSKGNRAANYFIAAWTFYLFGGLLLTLRNSGVFDFNFWTTHFVEIGAMMETTLIAFALADRYRRMRLENEQAQALALRVQLEANEVLERKVAERTEQLSRINTELSVTLETNQQQTKIIEEKNVELDSFFYRISHDLKGPIASLLGLTQLAKRQNKDESTAEYLVKQEQQAERLNTIVSGLIDLTKLNQNDLKKQRIDFDKLVEECISSFHSYDNFAKIEFKTEIQTGIEFDYVWSLLNAIIQNLVENAIKYAGAQSPFVSVRISQSNNQLVIEVEDNGLGIAAEHQARIFDMFYRASHHGNGTGLGLYILKRSVDRLNGTIVMQTELGKGSKFTVSLPQE
jgi:signal transduction histidine kinase